MRRGALGQDINKPCLGGNKKVVANGWKESTAKAGLQEQNFSCCILEVAYSRRISDGLKMGDTKTG